MILICAQVNCNEISTNRLRFNIQDQRLYCFDHYKLKDRKKKRKPKFQPIPSHWLSEDINGLINLTCSQGENCPSDKLEVVDKNLLCENHIPLQRPLDTKELSVTKQDLQTYPPSAPPHIAPKTVKKLELRQNDVFLKLDENIPESDKLNSLPVTIKCTLEKLVEQIDNGQDEETQQDCNISMRLLFKSISKEASKRFHSGGISLADCTNKSILKESALLGLSNTEEIFLNLYEPFCIATFGLQGSGKSHSLSVIVENCLLSTSNCVHNEDKVIIDLKTSMCCLVLHYDQSAQSVCEVTGLTKPRIGRSLCLSNDRMIVLVSPTYYLQRKAFYGPNINVRPLLFEWRTMTADRLRKLMRLSSDDTQLYVATLLDILRSYQRLNRLPLFKDFINEVCSKADVKGQSAPLIQRLNILQSFIHESSKNSAIKAYALDISAAIKSGFLIVADISDPLLSKEEASGVFELLVESFRTAPLTGCGKLLALDEAHKFMSGKGNEGLDKAILDAARLMRHDGLRLVISTQSPKALNPEILELVSVAILHRFQSRDWFNYLQSKIELNEFDFETIKTLAPGSAVVFAGRRLFSGDLDYLTYEKNFLMQVRPRITQDRGSSLVNKGQEVNSALNEVPNISHVDLESEDYSTSNNLISFTQSSEIDSDISKAELMDDLEEINSERSSSESDSLKRSFSNKKQFKSLMFAILSLESSDGTISFEDIRNLKMVQKAIDSGQLSESLKEIRESRKMWFKVVMLRQKEFLIRKGILLVKKL